MWKLVLDAIKVMVNVREPSPSGLWLDLREFRLYKLRSVLAEIGQCLLYALVSSQPHLAGEVQLKGCFR